MNVLGSLVRRWLHAIALAMAVAVFTPQRAVAQQLQDVVYLKDGSIIRGTIVEQRPGESILIKTADGSVFRYAIDKIDRMTREAPVASTGTAAGRLRNPAGAWALSFLITGGGQAYNDQWGKGAAFFGATILGAVLVGAAYGNNADCLYPASYGYHCGGGDNPGVVTAGVVLALGSWIWSQIDAPLTASANNRRVRGGLSLELRPSVVNLAAWHVPRAVIFSAEQGSLRMPTAPQLGLSVVTIRF